MSFIGVGLGIPLVGYVISPAFKRREQSWVALGKVNDVPVHEPTQLTYVASLRDGYMETTVQKAVWAVKKRQWGSDGLLSTMYAPGLWVSME
jgi:menaquinol-cytochrome c reductase iron-sulfur subunit